MEKRLEILSRAITLECYANGFARRALREIDAYRETPGDAWRDDKARCGMELSNQHQLKPLKIYLGRYP